MTHEMKLQPEPFDRIKDGTKKIESRLYDEKRQLIQLGDEIVFKRNPESVESVTARVVGLLHYPTFSAMFHDFDPAMFGGESQQFLEEQIYAFYSKEDESKCGVLGIRIEVNSSF